MGYISRQQLTLGRTRRVIPLPWYKGKVDGPPPLLDVCDMLQYFETILPSVEILYTGLYTGFLANDEERLYSKAKIMRDNTQREMNSHNSSNYYYSTIEYPVPEGLACSQTLYFLFKVRRACVIKNKTAGVSLRSRARRYFRKERKEKYNYVCVLATKDP